MSERSEGQHAVSEKVARVAVRCLNVQGARRSGRRSRSSRGVIGRRDRRCPMSERSEGQHAVSEKVARVAVPYLNVQGRRLNVQRWKHGHGPPLSHRRRSSRRYSCPLHPLRKLRKVRKAPQAPPSRTLRAVSALSAPSCRSGFTCQRCRVRPAVLVDLPKLSQNQFLSEINWRNWFPADASTRC